MTRSFFLFTFFFILFSFLFSCRSIPVSTLRLPSSLPLDSGASMYVFGNAENAGPFLNLFLAEYLNDRNVIMMLERTDFFAAALFQTGSRRSFQIAAWGNYPSTRAGAALGTNREWEKQRSGDGNFWYSQNAHLSLSISSKQLFIKTSQEGPVNPVSSSNIEMSPNLIEFNRNLNGNSITIWNKDPGDMLDKIMGDMGIPIRFPVQELFISITPITEDQYETGIRMLFDNPTQARGVTGLLTLASSFMSSDNISGTNAILYPVFFANAPVQNNENLDIKSASLNENELNAFFRLFL